LTQGEDTLSGNRVILNGDALPGQFTAQLGRGDEGRQIFVPIFFRMRLVAIPGWPMVPCIA